jgi:hypothetical protein
VQKAALPFRAEPDLYRVAAGMGLLNVRDRDVRLALPAQPEDEGLSDVQVVRAVLPHGGAAAPYGRAVGEVGFPVTAGAQGQHLAAASEEGTTAERISTVELPETLGILFLEGKEDGLMSLGSPQDGGLYLAVVLFGHGPSHLCAPSCLTRTSPEGHLLSGLPQVDSAESPIALGIAHEGTLRQSIASPERGRLLARERRMQVSITSMHLVHKRPIHGSTSSTWRVRSWNESTDELAR